MRDCRWVDFGTVTISIPVRTMHLEFLIEDRSGGRLLDSLLPKLLGNQGQPHTWRVHFYRGTSRLPKDLKPTGDPGKRDLLDQLPRLLRGYGRSGGIDAVVVILDSDRRDCRSFLAELQAVLSKCEPAPKTMFRLAIEEMEAWYLGDRAALLTAYPRAKKDVLNTYRQDSVCGTWECLANAVYKGGVDAIKRQGWPAPGQIKAEWAETIGPLMDPDTNLSPSFCKLRDGLRRLTS